VGEKSRLKQHWHKQHGVSAMLDVVAAAAAVITSSMTSRLGVMAQHHSITPNYSSPTPIDTSLTRPLFATVHQVLASLHACHRK